MSWEAIRPVTTRCRAKQTILRCGITRADSQLLAERFFVVVHGDSRYSTTPCPPVISSEARNLAKRETFWAGVKISPRWRSSKWHGWRSSKWHSIPHWRSLWAILGNLWTTRGVSPIFSVTVQPWTVTLLHSPTSWIPLIAKRICRD